MKLGGSYKNIVRLGKTIALVKVVDMEMVVEVKLYELKGMELGGKVSSVNGSSLLLNARDAVAEEFVPQLKGKEKLITVAEVQLDFLALCRVRIMLYLSQNLLVTHYMVWQMETPTAPMIL